MSLAFFLKVCIPPILVALMSLAARVFGPTIGGLIMGLPWMTGPVLFFLATDKGDAFAVEACTGIELGMLAIVAFMAGYAAVAHFAPWLPSIVAAAFSFAATGWLLSYVSVPLWLATLAAISSLVAAYVLLPRPRALPPPVPLPWWDIPARMLATFCLVAGIMTTADRLGPQLSGIASTFPVIITVIGIFTHAQRGIDALLAIYRGVSLSMLAFCAFFAVVGYGLPWLGRVPAFAVAAVSALSISAVTIAVNRWYARRGAR